MTGLTAGLGTGAQGFQGRVLKGGIMTLDFCGFSRSAATDFARLEIDNRAFAFFFSEVVAGFGAGGGLVFNLSAS